MTRTVRVLSTSGDAPVLIDGHIANESDGIVAIDCSADAAGLPAGARVIVSFNEDGQKLTGTVESVAQTESGSFQLRVVQSGAHQRDQRDFPRLYAGIPIRYRTSDSAELTAAWVRGDDIDGNWHEPDPYMNFSVGGLRFDGLDSLTQDDELLIDLAIGDGNERWRVSGRVIRVFEQSESADEGTRSIAVSFVHLPEDARDALSELTLAIQDSLL